MIRLVSRYFGTFDISEDDVVHFPVGLPGFEDQTRFAALSIPGQEPILYLQSLTCSELCLITLPSRVFCPDYRLELNPEEREILGLPMESKPSIGREIACQAIITVDENREPAANLAGPLVINLSTRVGIQVFQLASEYTFRHPIGEILQPIEC
jgi:flagellar assembly factor FliW